MLYEYISAMIPTLWDHCWYNCWLRVQNSTLGRITAKTGLQHCWSESSKSLKQLCDFISGTHAATNNGNGHIAICPVEDEGGFGRCMTLK